MGQDELIILSELSRDPDQKDKPLCIVRLTTSAWMDSKGAYIKKSLNFLKKKSSGYQILPEEINMIGALDVFNNIVNLNECEDGIYLVTTCNESRDWESGHIDSYDYKLLKYEQ